MIKLRQIVETARLTMNTRGDTIIPKFDIMKAIAIMEDEEFKYLCRIISLGFTEDMQDV